MESTKADTREKLDLCMRIFAEGATRWRGLKGTAAVLLLVEILDKPLVKDWLRGEERLSLDLAVKAVLFALGVQGSTPLPNGHEHGNYFKPIIG